MDMTTLNQVEQCSSNKKPLHGEEQIPGDECIPSPCDHEKEIEQCGIFVFADSGIKHGILPEEHLVTKEQSLTDTKHTDPPLLAGMPEETDVDSPEGADPGVQEVAYEIPGIAELCLPLCGDSSLQDDNSEKKEEMSPPGSLSSQNELVKCEEEEEISLPGSLSSLNELVKCESPVQNVDPGSHIHKKKRYSNNMIHKEKEKEEISKPQTLSSNSETLLSVPKSLISSEDNTVRARNELSQLRKRPIPDTRENCQLKKAYTRQSVRYNNERRNNIEKFALTDKALKSLQTKVMILEKALKESEKEKAYLQREISELRQERQKDLSDREHMKKEMAELRKEVMSLKTAQSESLLKEDRAHVVKQEE